MLQKPSSCEGCVLHTTGKGFCPDEIVENEEYCIFGEAPGSTEIQVGRPFQGKAGFVLHNWLIRAVPQLQLAYEKKRISFRNILKCLPPDNKGRPYPSGKEKEAAEAHCKQYQSGIKAPVVILCGEVPQRYFFEPELDAEDAAARRLGRDAPGVMGRVGREIEKDGKRWVFAPHPAYILRQPALVQHGQNSLKIAANTERKIEPDYIRWDVAIQELYGN
jgi:uracil-DNA glycosylase